MARNQTVFSELTVAQAIGNCDLSEIKNVNKLAIFQYGVEDRQRSLKDPASKTELIKTGKKIRKWLIEKKHIDNIKVSWTGMKSDSNNDSVAQDILILNNNMRVSVKENAQLFQNPSPVKVFEKWPKGLFDKSRDGDWFLKIANRELDNYFEACNGYKLTGFNSVSQYYSNVAQTNRKKFTTYVANLHEQNNPQVLNAYKNFVNQVSLKSAVIFNKNLELTYPSIKNGIYSAQELQKLFSFFFKLDPDKHIICGTENTNSFAILVDDILTWEKKYSIVKIEARPRNVGQAEVIIDFTFLNKVTNYDFTYSIQCQIRWSHGKFCGNPESKLYRFNSWSYNDLAWGEKL
jgi:hypothetical protein